MRSFSPTHPQITRPVSIYSGVRSIPSTRHRYLLATNRAGPPRPHPISDRVNYRLEKRASAGRWSHFCEAIACEGPESLRHDLFWFDAGWLSDHSLDCVLILSTASAGGARRIRSLTFGNVARIADA